MLVEIHFIMIEPTERYSYLFCATLKNETRSSSPGFKKFQVGFFYLDRLSTEEVTTESISNSIGSSTNAARENIEALNFILRSGFAVSCSCCWSGAAFASAILTSVSAVRLTAVSTTCGAGWATAASMVSTTGAVSIGTSVSTSSGASSMTAREKSSASRSTVLIFCSILSNSGSGGGGGVGLHTWPAGEGAEACAIVGCSWL